MRNFLSFDFWQKFGKSLLVVVAVMPAAGIMISIGKLIGMTGGDIALVQTIVRVLEDIGWGIITNLHILFGDTRKIIENWLESYPFCEGSSFFM